MRCVSSWWRTKGASAICARASASPPRRPPPSRLRPGTGSCWSTPRRPRSPICAPSGVPFPGRGRSMPRRWWCGTNPCRPMHWCAPVPSRARADLSLRCTSWSRAHRARRCGRCSAAHAPTAARCAMRSRATPRDGGSEAGRARGSISLSGRALASSPPSSTGPSAPSPLRRCVSPRSRWAVRGLRRRCRRAPRSPALRARRPSLRGSSMAHASASLRSRSIPRWLCSTSPLTCTRRWRRPSARRAPHGC